MATSACSPRSPPLRASPRRVDRRGPRQRCSPKVTRPHSWRTFQLAFILMQLPLLTDPAAPMRSRGDLAKAQLLFFPTGGGKTEAYLGLAAYTFAIRRLQGVVDTAGRPARRTRRGRRADAVHAAAADRPAVPAGDRAGLRGRAGAAADEADLGQRAVPDRAVGRDRRQPETVRRGRGAAQAGQRVRRATG